MAMPPLGPQVGAKYARKGQILKNLLLYSNTCEEKTKGMVIMSMKPITKTVKFMTLGTGWGQYGHIRKMY